MDDFYAGWRHSGRIHHCLSPPYDPLYFPRAQIVLIISRMDEVHAIQLFNRFANADETAVVITGTTSNFS